MLKYFFSLGLVAMTLNPFFSQKNAEKRDYYDDFRKAVRFIESEKYEDAQDLLEDIPEQDSLFLKAQFRLQQLYNRSENFPKVVEIGSRLSRLPFNGGHFVYNNWAMALSNMEKFDEALAVTNEGLVAYSESHLLHYRRGMVLQELKRHQEAMHAFQRAVHAYPMHVYSHLKLGEMAAHEGRYSQAIMSLVYATLLDDAPAIKSALHLLLEKISLLEFEAESKELVFDEGDDFSEIDRMIQSKIALLSKFKLKSKIKAFAYVRQLQVICEAIRFDAQADGFWMQQYADFFQAVFVNDFFDGLTYASLYGPEYGKINAAAFKNTKKRDAFVLWFANNFDRFMLRQYLDFEGKKQITYVDLGQQNVAARGLGTSFSNRQGIWQLFDGLNGRPVGTGPFADGERHGEWELFDETTGLLSRRLNFSKGDLNGLFTSYFPNGKPEITVNMKDDLRQGQRVVFYPSGDTLILDNHVKGARTGDFTQYHPNNSIRLKGKLEDDNWNGQVLEYHTNGKLSAELNYKNDLREGLCTYYHINGTVKQKINFKADEPVDDFEAYHINGQLESKGRYKNGIRVGKWVSYYFDGRLEEELEFDENGKQNAIQKSFDRDGKLHYEMEYKNGELQSYKFYDKSGKIVAQDKRSGKKLNYKFYDPRGVLKTEGALNNDEKTGLWTYYNDRGVKEKEHKYEIGKVVGKSQSFYASGAVDVDENYVNGDLDGLVLGYHPNGELRLEGYFREGQRNGMWYFYYPDGKLKQKEYYVAGEVSGWAEEYAVNGLLYAKFFHEDEDIKRAVYFDVSGNPMDTIQEYHGQVVVPNPNGKDVLEKNNFKNDVRHGRSEAFYLNDKLSASGDFFNKVRNGLWTNYHENGAVSSLTKYVHGEIDSIRTEYRMNGNVASRTPYQNGVIVGTGEHYHPNGALHYKVDYMAGDREGEVVMKLPSGEIYAVFYYENDVLVSYTHEGADGKLKAPVRIQKEEQIRCFFKNGAASLVATLNNGEWNGDYIIYSPSGEIIEKKNYLHGYINGVSVFNFSSKQAYSSISYAQGLRHGQMTLHHLNGKVMLESMYVQGKKHGEEKEFDNKGKAIYSRMYYNGEMISEVKL